MATMKKNNNTKNRDWDNAGGFRDLKPGEKITPIKKITSIKNPTKKKK